MSKETGLLKEWPKEGPPLAWRVKGLGGGDSAPSIAAGQIYGMGISARAKSYEPCLLAPRTKTHRTPHLPLDQSVVA